MVQPDENVICANEFNLIPAPEALKDYVEYFWTTKTNDGVEPSKLEITAFVHGASGIISQHHRGSSAFVHQGTCSGRDFYDGNLPTSFVCGQITEPTLTHMKKT